MKAISTVVTLLLASCASGFGLPPKIQPTRPLNFQLAALQRPGQGDNSFQPVDFVSESSREGGSGLKVAASAAAVASLVVLAGAEPALAAAPSWVAPTRLALDPFLLYFEFAFLCRIVLSWYPKTNLNTLPANLVAWPTEPLLRPTRAVVPPAFGVDISPIVWVMILSFLREILLGQQGLLTLLSNK